MFVQPSATTFLPHWQGSNQTGQFRCRFEWRRGSASLRRSNVPFEVEELTEWVQDYDQTHLSLILEFLKRVGLYVYEQGDHQEEIPHRTQVQSFDALQQATIFPHQGYNNGIRRDPEYWKLEFLEPYLPGNSVGSGLTWKDQGKPGPIGSSKDVQTAAWLEISQWLSEVLIYSRTANLDNQVSSGPFIDNFFNHCLATWTALSAWLLEGGW